MARPIRLRIARGPVLALLVTVSIVEIVWTIYLGLRLPRHYVANHWDLAWVGLDVGEIAMMLITAWAAWRRRAVFILFACCSRSLWSFRSDIQPKPRARQAAPYWIQTERLCLTAPCISTRSKAKW